VTAEYVAVARASDIPPGTVRVVTVRDREIAVCNVGGRFYAIDNVCTHDGGSLDQGDLDEEAIECPRHGARFDVRTGAVLAMPAVAPVATYPVRVQGTEIEVAVDES
jgi:3-phenylpropionate/trans-cinnamate dioxygenase ferredoxin subunit